MQRSLFVLMALVAFSADAALQIARGGKARCVIVRQPGATEPEQYAATELAETLRQITGAEFPVEVAGAKIPDHAILVGPGPATTTIFPEVALDQFGGEELILRTAGGRLLLA